MSGKKTRQIKNATNHRYDDTSKMVPLTVKEYETLTNKILELNTTLKNQEDLVIFQNKRIQQLTLDLDNTQQLAKKETSVIVISPKIKNSLKYSFTRLAMRLMNVSGHHPGEITKVIDHAVEQASKFLQVFSAKGNLGVIEKDLFFEEDVNGIINVSEHDPKN